jgi:hypothetical protein
VDLVVVAAIAVALEDLVAEALVAVGQEETGSLLVSLF